MRRLSASLILVFGLVAGAAAQTAQPATVFGLRFPENVGGFVLNDTTNFERSNPGQGYLLDYNLPGCKLDVFVYDLRRIAIPDDARSAIVRAEFERSREDAFLSAPRGPYAQVFLRRNFTLDDGKKVTRFQCAAFHMRRDGAKPQDGFLCVTSLRNKFVKLRLTTLAHQGTEAQARQHVAAWIPVLWGGANAAAAPAASKKAAPRRPAQRRPPQRQPVRR